MWYNETYLRSYKGEYTMHKDLQEILVSEEEIREKVKEIAARINEDYKGKELLLIIILKGSIIFATDLMRYLDGDILIDCMQVSSYGASSVSSGNIQIKKDLGIDVYGKNVLIIEDIIDSGHTLQVLKSMLKKRGANVEIAAFLSKPSRREVEVDVKYLGAEIPDEFVVGYGLDYAEHYRNLPYIGILKREVYEK